MDRPIPALHRLGEGREKNRAVWEEAERWLLSKEEYRDRALMIKNGSKIKNAELPLSRENLSRLYGKKAYTSVSRLEAFAECPFKYFARYSLGAKPRKIYEVRTPDIGSMFHSVLEKLLWKMRDEGLTWRTIGEDEAKKLAGDIIDSLVPELKTKYCSARRPIPIL